MNQTIITKTNEEIEKIKGRTASFGVTVEDTEEPEEPLFKPQRIAMQFLNFINIDNSNEGNDDDFDSLFQFIDYLANLIMKQKNLQQIQLQWEFKKPRR